MGVVQIKTRRQHFACQVITYRGSVAAPLSSLNRENVSWSVVTPATSCTPFVPTTNYVCPFAPRQKWECEKSYAFCEDKRKTLGTRDISRSCYWNSADIIFCVSTKIEFWTQTLFKEAISSQTKNIHISLTTSKWKKPVNSHWVYYKKVVAHDDS